MQDSSLLSKFETCNAFNSLDCGEEMGDAAEEETGEHVGAETDETTEEAAGAHVGSDVAEGVETEEIAEERSAASPGMLRGGVAMFHRALWTLVGGVGGAIGRIATALFIRVETADKTCPVRELCP